MKISDASISLGVAHTSREVDLFLEENRSQVVKIQQIQPRISRINDAVDSKGMMVWVDRVSISHEQTHAFQSEYSGTLSSNSRVWSAQADEAREFEQEEMVKTLVGAVIDREVVVREIQAGQEISVNMDREDFPGDRAKKTVSTGISGRVSGPIPGGVQVTEASQYFLKQTKIRFEEEQLEFAASGQVTTEDGRAIDFSLDLTMDRAMLSRTDRESLVHTWQEQVNLTDPLVVSLDGRAPLLTDTKFGFDLDNDGKEEAVSFTARGSGFLAFDRNNDGKINNGGELFGPGTGNGFEELAALDGDNNRWIDENDAVFLQLSVWTRNENGEDRLISLKDAGIGAISLDYASVSFDYAGRDARLDGRLRSSGMFLFENGNVGTIQQIDLAAGPLPKEEKDLDLIREKGEPDTGAGRSFPGNILATGRLPGTMDPGFVREPGAGETPLEALKEQIKKLREEMDQILGKSAKARARFRDEARASLSRFQLYRITRPDTDSILPAGSSMKKLRWQEWA